MLSMAFISLLLLAIAMLVLQVTSIYNKGLTLRDVNEVGRLVTTDIQRTLNQANPEKVSFAPEDNFDSASGGRFCIGSTVYAWNYGRTIVNPDGNIDPWNKYDSREDPIRLVKFQEDGKKYCSKDINGVYPKLPDSAADRDLLLAGDKSLAIHKFTIEQSVGAAGDPDQTMYYVTVRLGTSESAILEGNGCEAPVNRIEDEYCAVNDFIFVARAGSTEESNE